MRGEWFDTVSNCVTFSISAKKTNPIKVMKFRHTIVRLMSLAHGSALEEIAGDQVQLETIDIFGLDAGTLRHLKTCHETYKFNKVEVMLHLVQSLIIQAHEDGIIKVPPPILSRVYQTISRGFVNLLNAKKITDTRFPFPYAQLIAFLLMALTVLTPLMLSALLSSKVLVALFCFVPIFGLFSLNFIAIELENPFGVDTNDLPLQHFQDEMNSCLLMLLHDNTDLIASVTETCMMDFQALYKEMLPHLAGVNETEEETAASRRKTRLSDFKTELDDDEEDGMPVIGFQHTLEAENRTPVKEPIVKEASTPATTVSVEPPKQEPTRLAGEQSGEKKDVPSAEPKIAKMPPSFGRNATDPTLPDAVKAPTSAAPALACFPATPTGKTSAIPQHDMQPLLDKSMSDFNRSMQRWTQVIDSQVGELHRNCHALQRFNDSLAAVRPDQPWEGSLPAV